MKVLFLLVFCISINTLNAQQSIKYNKIQKGRVYIKYASAVQFVNWQISECIVDNKDTIPFFFLPKSIFNDVSVSGLGSKSFGNSYGIFITSKAELLTFAEGLIYLGKQKGKKSEQLIITKNEIVIGILSTAPKYVIINDIIMSKSTAVRFGKKLLKRIDYLKN